MSTSFKTFTISSAPAVSAANEGRIYFNGTRFFISENGGAYVPIDGYYQTGILQLQVSLDATAIAAGGAVTSHQYTLVQMPNPAIFVGAEVIVAPGLSGSGLVSATATLEGASDAAGAILAAASVTTAGVKAPTGSNPYLSRSGQFIFTTITTVGINLSAITGGDLVFNLFYFIPVVP